MESNNVPPYNLNRFIIRQERIYSTALSELVAGKKESCWMWYIFPQLRALGKSRKSYVFGLTDPREAAAYLAHPVLGPRLLECCNVLLSHKDKSALEILGEIDCIKLQSSMTLFSLISWNDSIFHEVLLRFFDGEPDILTLNILYYKKGELK